MTSESNGHVPLGWSVARLHECVDVLDKARRPVNATERAKRQGTVPYYGATGQVGWIDEPLFDEELLLLGEDGAPFLDKSKPIAYVIDGPSWVNNHAHVLRARPTVTSNRYVKYFLDSFDFSDRVGGSTRDKLTQRDMNSIPILLAPAEQQRQIVRALDEIGSRRATIAARLAAARVIVDRLRVAVLAAACAGRLTGDWRGDFDDAVTKRDELGAERPTGWSRAQLGDVSLVMLGGTPSRKVDDYWGGDVPWVSSGEVANCRISDTRERITNHGLENSNAKLYPAGTVLIAMIGEGKTRGQAAILDIPAATNQNAAGVQVNREVLDPEFTWRWALSEYERTRSAGRGGNQPALNGQKVRELMITIPPLDQQREIVRRIDGGLKLVGRLEHAVGAAECALQGAARGASARAFRGELVAADEDVSSAAR